MKKIVFAFLFSIICATSLHAAAQFKSGTLPLVDGVYNSTQVVVTARQPVFSWEVGDIVSSFTVIVSSDNAFDLSGELWNYFGTTSTANTINYITRVPYNIDGTASAPLEAGKTYYWGVAIWGEDGSIATAASQFFTVASVVTLPAEKLTLAVDWNNPFNPATGQVTRFRFAAKDRDRKVQLRVFTLSGDLVRDWPEQTALKDAWYTQTWDGKNDQGDTVARGIYFVNIIDVGEPSTSSTRRVAVIKQQ